MSRWCGITGYFDYYSNSNECVTEVLLKSISEKSKIGIPTGSEGEIGAQVIPMGYYSSTVGAEWFRVNVYGNLRDYGDDIEDYNIINEWFSYMTEHIDCGVWTCTSGYLNIKSELSYQKVWESDE